MVQTSRSPKLKKSRNFLVSVLDTWKKYHIDMPRQQEAEMIKEKIKSERQRKLGSRIKNKKEIFAPKEIAIVKELIVNPRKSYIEIAKELGLSRQTVKKKIDYMTNHSKIKFFVGVNYEKMNLDLVILNFIFANLKFLDDLYQELRYCPRVFSISKNIAQNSLLVLFGIEKSLNKNHNNQMVCIIEKFQLDERIKECSVISIHPEMFPVYLIFSPKNLNDTTYTPQCSTNCPTCPNYINQKCPGCPLLGEYKRNIFKTS